MSNAKTEYQIHYRLRMNGDDYEPGETLSLSDKDAKPLLMTNPPVITVPDKAEEIQSDSNVVQLNNTAPENQGERINQIQAAIIGLDNAVKSNWNNDGTPDAKVLSERLSWKVKAAERNQAWMELQDNRDT